MSTGRARPTGVVEPVGRQRELAELLGGLDDVADGHHGRVFLLSGEPGIGKTTLARTLTEHARAVGAEVAWGRCWEGGGAPAFWSWTQVLRAVLRSPAGQAGLQQLGEDAEQVARVVPELAARLGREPRDTGRFPLFDAVTRLLMSAAEDAPLVVVQDDLHAADEASLRLLQFLASELHSARLLVVGTFRDVEARLTPSGALLAELVREARSLPLGGLDLAETGALVESVTGRVDDSLTRSLHETTRGNPFFLRELLQLVVAQGQPAPLGVPDSVRDAIRRRLDLVESAMGGGLRQVMTVAAVTGHEVRRPFLEYACGQPPGALLGVLDSAVQTGLLQSVAHDRYTFRHALVREALYQGLPSATRSRLHATVAEAIEGFHGERMDEHVAELAHHMLEAGPAVERHRAVRKAREAGDRASAQLAYEEAARWYDRALEETDSDRLRCDLLIATGAAKARAGQPEQARENLQRAADLARTLDEPHRFASAVFELGGLLRWGSVDHEYVDLAEEALGRLDDEVLRVKVLGRLTAALRFDTRRAYRRALADQAVALARRVEDASLLAYALDMRLYAIWGPDTIDEILAVSDEIVDLAEHAGDRYRAFQGHMWRLIAHFEYGDIAAVSGEIEALAVLADRLREPRLRLFVTSRRAARAFFVGDSSEGERLAREAFAIGRRADDPEAFAVFADQIAYPLWDQGRPGEVDQLLARVEDEIADAEPIWRARLSTFLLQAGRRDQARAVLEAIPQEEFAEFVRRFEPFTIAVPAIFGLTARASGSMHLVSWAYELLRPYEHRNVVTSGAVAAWGCVARYLGVFATALGEHDRAAAHFEVALERHTSWGARPWMVHTQVDYARLLLSRREPGDADRARSLLDEALAGAETLGMARITDDVRGLQGQLGQPPSGEDELRREGDVWAITHRGRVCRVKDSKGLRYLAYLLAHPDIDVHVLELAGAPIMQETEEPVLDQQAKKAYRDRLRELSDDLAGAQANHDSGRIDRVQQEIEFLEQELTAAVGLGGGDRALASQAERARVAVTKAIRRAIRNIGEHDDALGRYLDLTVQTGRFCRYGAPPGEDVWRPVTQT